MYSFKRCSLSIYCVSGIGIGLEHIVANTAIMLCAVMELIVWWGRETVFISVCQMEVNTMKGKTMCYEKE